MAERRKRILTWKSYHKWVGVILAVFMLVFCISGVILNHRRLFADCQVSRSWLPGSYQFRNYNNGILKGTMSLNDSTVLAYGCAGVWLTDRGLTGFKQCNAGLPMGVDGRNVKNVIRTTEGTLWCAALYDLYRHDGSKWVKQELPGNEERLSDVTTDEDGLRVVALTRSAVYVLSPSVDGAAYKAERFWLSSPEEYTPKVTLFKTFWMLHSGELFGTAGKLVVDFVAVIMIVLCLTGILLFILPYAMRRHRLLFNGKLWRWEGNAMRWNRRWHDRLGYYLLILMLLVTVTGMSLRPPLMIPLVMAKTPPLPGTVQRQDNVWHDKLRAIRWDKSEDSWLISTSEGFMRVDRAFRQPPVLLPPDKVPIVSPMGVTVWEPETAGHWLIGSFSGLFRWSPADGKVVDYFSGEVVKGRRGRPISDNLVCGYSKHLAVSDAVVFDYAKGASEISAMPRVLKEQPMSLWNFALELHVGRCYTPFLGPFSELFVFFSGVLISLVILSGYIIYVRQKRKQKNLNKTINQ